MMIKGEIWKIPSCYHAQCCSNAPVVLAIKGQVVVALRSSLRSGSSLHHFLRMADSSSLRAGMADSRLPPVRASKHRGAWACAWASAWASTTRTRSPTPSSSCRRQGAGAVRRCPCIGLCFVLVAPRSADASGKAEQCPEARSKGEKAKE